MLHNPWVEGFIPVTGRQAGEEGKLQDGPWCGASAELVQLDETH